MIRRPILLLVAVTLLTGPAPASPPAPPVAEGEARGLLALGASLTERGDYAAAEIAYRQVLAARGGPVADQQDALLGITRMYRRQGSYAKAAAIAEKFLQEFPEDVRRPALLLELGRTLRAMGAHQAAISRFYAVINSTLRLPTDGFEEYQVLARTAQFEVAETHLEAGNYAEAGKFFARLRLLDLAPVDQARAHFKAGFALQLGGELDGAVRLLADFVRQWPADENAAEARHLLASTLWRLERRDEALAVTLDLLKAEQARAEGGPRRWTYWQRRTGNQLANEFFQTGDPRSALAIYLGLASLSPEPAWRLPSLYQAALCYERLNAVEPAHAAYRAIAAETPPDAGPELAELARMAAWRLEHLAWNAQTSQKLGHLFASLPPPAPTPPPAPPVPAHDAHGSPPAAPAGL
jgi:tetratricopeptide (TPR) repeat protein